MGCHFRAYLSGILPRVTAPQRGQHRVLGLGQRRQAPHTGESGKTSQRWRHDQGIHFFKPKATTPDPAAGQAPWASWGHLALLLSPSLLSLAPRASGCLCCFLQASPPLAFSMPVFLRAWPPLDLGLLPPGCQLPPPHWHLLYVEPSFRSGSSCPAVTLPGLHALNHYLHPPTVPGKSSCPVSKFREWSCNLPSPLSQTGADS